MTLKVETITDNIVRISADTIDNLAMTFLRFQEHYESPQFRNQIFTLGQFRKWYAEKYGAFTYSNDWVGFNIPSYVLDAFKQGLFDPLSPQEQTFLNMFKDRQDKFYIIGAQEGDLGVLDHEICHALFYVNEKYRKQVEHVIENNSKALKPVFDHVASMMYHPSVHLDEVHAYTSANIDSLEEAGILVDSEIHTALRKIKDKHFNLK